MLATKNTPKRVDTMPDSVLPQTQSYSKKKSVSQIKRHQTIDLDDLGNDDERPTHVTRQQSKVGSSSYFKAQQQRTKQKKKTINFKAREDVQKIQTIQKPPETLNSDRDVFANFFENTQAPKLSTTYLILQETILRVSIQQGLVVWLYNYLNPYIAVGIALEVTLFTRILPLRELNKIIYAIIFSIHAFAILTVYYGEVSTMETYFVSGCILIELVIESIYLQQ